MAITSVGYDGSITEVQWAQMISNVGSSVYGVVGVNDWKVTAHPTLDKGVNIAAGTGYGYGVLDVNSAPATVAGATLASGTRFDLVVARRDWTGAGGVTTFRVVTGTSSRTLPGRTTGPGSVDEQPIALLRFDAGQTSPTEIIDLRVWSGPGGALALDEMVLGYLNMPGGRVYINGSDWVCTIVSGAPSWTKVTVAGRLSLYGTGGAAAGGAPGQPELLVQAGNVAQNTNKDGFFIITWPKPFPNGILMAIANNGDESAWGGMAIGAAGWEWGTTPLNKTQGIFMPRQSNSGGLNRLLPNRRIRVNYIAIGW